MVGYWGQQVHEDRPYATGDRVLLQSDGDYTYLGRHDQMTKLRGYRVECGDIEAALEEHPAIREVVVMVLGTGLDARLVAFVVVAGGEIPTLLEIKRHCSTRLPRYMIIDEMRVISALPRTRNGKIDRLALSIYEVAIQTKGEK
jgi:acyl-coenzyme A synthetase/AMP-(fatty) acid ligase